MKKIKVKVIKEIAHPFLKEILPLGFETILVFDDGTYTFETKDGNVHSEKTLAYYIGPRPINEIFEKI